MAQAARARARSKPVGARRPSEVTLLQDAATALATVAGVDLAAAKVMRPAPVLEPTPGGGRGLARFKRSVAAVSAASAVPGALALPQSTLAGKLAAPSVSVNPPRATSAIAETACEARSALRRAPAAGTVGRRWGAGGHRRGCRL